VRIFPSTCIACLITASLFVTAKEGNSQDQEIVRSINDPRPLAEAVRQLEERLGTAISYEDVAPVYSRDYARPLDTDWGRKASEHDDRYRGTNRIELAGGALEIHIPVDPAGKPMMPVSQVLWDLIEQHRARGNPGQFQLLTINDSLVIVPTEKRDTAGAFVPEYSPLDTQISFPVARRSGAETLKVITEAVSSASGRTVHVGQFGINLFAQTAIELGADHERARDVLMRALKGLRWADGRRVPDVPKVWSWQLLCGPDRLMTTTPTLADISCALNLRSFQ
jgi:hypothetical protein